jgi:hypothetical protein
MPQHFTAWYTHERLLVLPTAMPDHRWFHGYWLVHFSARGTGYQPVSLKVKYRYILHGSVHNTYQMFKDSLLSIPYGGGVGCLYRIPTSHRRWWKCNTVLGVITWPPCSWGYKYGDLVLKVRDPVCRRVEYLYRDPASRRRRKGKSKIWDSKIWQRVQRDSDPRKTRLARTSSIYRRQTRPLVRESAPQKQDRNCQRLINILS